MLLDIYDQKGQLEELNYNHKPKLKEVFKYSDNAMIVIEGKENCKGHDNFL